MKNSSFFANRADRTLYVHDGAANYIVAYVFQIIFQLLFTIVLIATMTVDERNAFSGSFAYITIIAILNEISIILTPISYSKVLGQNYYKDMGFKKKLNVLQIALLVVIAIVLVVASAPIASAVMNFFLSTGFNGSSIATLVVTNVPELIVGLLFFAILPAVAEEVMYRGMIARAFSRKGIVFGIFVGSFLFSIMHGNPLQLTHQFLMGCVCSIVYFATGSIWAPIVVHFINNTIAVVGSYIVYMHPFDIPVYGQILMVVLGMIALVVLLYFFIVLNNKNASLKNGIQSMQKIFSECFISEEEKLKQEEKQKEIMAKLEETNLQEAKEVYAQTKLDMSQDEKMKANRALLFAFAFAIALLVINTIMGYV